MKNIDRCGNLLEDADGDTNVEVEKIPDEDFICFSTAGVAQPERRIPESNRKHLTTRSNRESIPVNRKFRHKFRFF
jgi:hypothetical protein